MMLWY